MSATHPRFSVVVPTHQRRELVTRTVAALDRQTSRGFEVVVVVDGSVDGTAAALRDLDVSFPLTVLEQANRGAAAARNAGASIAAGNLLLFLDDDMEADAQLLTEHERSHREGADIVLGHTPLHPNSPATILSGGVERWAERRRARLAGLGPELPGVELLTGQMSISRAAFESLAGFDASFTRHGLFGGEDRDFGHRAVAAGLRIVFNEHAVSHQYYAVDPAVYARRSREAGRAVAELKAKHPGFGDHFSSSREYTSRRGRVVFGLLGLAPAAVSAPLHAVAQRRVRSGKLDGRTYRLFFALQTMEFRRGLRRAARIGGSGFAVVLAYHAIADLGGDPVLAEYGVPARLLAEHLDMLARTGRTFVSLATLLNALEGEEQLPPGAVLLSFDDAYEDLLSAACPVLAERGIPAVTFVVAGRLGGTNDWDRGVGAASLSLLDDEGLRAVAAQGIAIGSHGMTHRRLITLEQAELKEELEESAARIAALGFPRPVAFSYPHGLWSPEVARAVRDAGYAAAFTVRAGVVRRDDRYALPRIEVLASDSARSLRLKIATARWPRVWRRRLLRLLGVEA
jgi:peptidoglycan/xylan/chitin deacetylase (PgdA/CDA1 family)/GT2 family glycosyltransferase